MTIDEKKFVVETTKEIIIASLQKEPDFFMTNKEGGGTDKYSENLVGHFQVVIDGIENAYNGLKK